MSSSNTLLALYRPGCPAESTPGAASQVAVAPPIAAVDVGPVYFLPLGALLGAEEPLAEPLSGITTLSGLCCASGAPDRLPATTRPTPYAASRSTTTAP